MKIDKLWKLGSAFLVPSMLCIGMLKLSDILCFFSKRKDLLLFNAVMFDI